MVKTTLSGFKKEKHKPDTAMKMSTMQRALSDDKGICER